MKKIFILSAISSVSSNSFRSVLGSNNGETTWLLDLTQNNNISKRELNKMFDKLYSDFHDGFDFDAYRKFSEGLKDTAERYGDSDVYRRVSSSPHCDVSFENEKLVSSIQTTHLAPFSGGNARRTYGFDLAKIANDAVSKVNGPASAQDAATKIIGLSALMMSKGLIQSAVSTAASIIPPTITPPVWNNKPLPCMPMVTGHHCFGAVNYPITFADFLLADVIDSKMAGLIENFPATFAAKVARGAKVPDSVYERCFEAYMSMHCSSSFSRCSSVQSYDINVPAIGKVPMCFPVCINVLIQCPGFTVEDLQGPCDEMSVPPMCALASYTRTDTLPPQSATFDENNSYPEECPKFNPEIDVGRGGSLSSFLATI